MRPALRDLRVRPPAVARREPGRRRAAARILAARRRRSGRARLVRRRQPPPPPRGRLRVRDRDRARRRLSEEFTRAAEALTGRADLDGKPAPSCSSTATGSFRRSWRRSGRAERTLNVQTYVYWRGEIAHDVAHAIRDKARDGVRCNVILDALGAVQMERCPDRRDARRRRARCFCFRPPKPYAIKRVANRTHRRAADRRRQGRDDRRGRDRSGVDGRCRGLRRTGATPTSASAGPWSAGCRAPSRRTGWRARARSSPGEDYLPELEPLDGGGRDAARPLQREGRRHQRRGPLLPRDRLGQRSIDLTCRLLRAAAGVHRGPLRGGAGAASKSGSWCPGRTSTRGSCGPGAGRPTASCWRRGCGCSSTSRRCCTRRRSASTAPGRPSGRSTSTTALSSSTTRSRWRLGRGLRRRPHGRVRGRHRALARDRAGALAAPAAAPARRRGADHGASPRALTPPILGGRARADHATPAVPPRPAPGASADAGGAAPCWRRSAAPISWRCACSGRAATENRSRSAMRALGLSGEYGAVWAVIGASAPRSTTAGAANGWLGGATVGPLAIGRQFRSQGRGRPRSVR